MVSRKEQRGLELELQTSSPYPGRWPIAIARYLISRGLCPAPPGSISKTFSFEGLYQVLLSDVSVWKNKLELSGDDW